MQLQFILLCLGLISAMIGSLIGLGGGVIIVPALLFLQEHFQPLAHITPQIAVGTSTVLIIFTAASSTLTFVKQKKVDMSSGFFFFLASGPGAVLGAYLNQYFSEAFFSLLFGCIILCMFFFLIINKRMRAKHIHWHVTKKYIDSLGNIYEYGYHRFLALVICFGIGILQGLLGIGGGALLVPALILLFWFPAHMAVGTTMLVILLSAISSSISHFMLGNVDWSLIYWIAPSALLGGYLGALLSVRLQSKRIILLLRITLIIISVQALWKGFSLLL